MKKLFYREAKQLLSNSVPEQYLTKVTSEKLEKLPATLRLYLEKTGVIGKDIAYNVRLEQKGTFRMKPSQNWAPLNATQYYHVPDGGFVWWGRIKLFGLIPVYGIDTFINGLGNLKIKILNLFKVVDVKGTYANIAEMMRFLSEIIWFPTAFLDEKITYSEIDSHKIQATFTAHGMEVSGVFHFDDNGLIEKFTAIRSYDVKTGEEAQWTTPIYEYKEMKGYLIPFKGAAVWHLKDGDFKYIDMEISKLEFNV